MNRMSYVFGLLFALLCLFFGAWGSGAYLVTFLDLISFVLVFGVTVALLRTGWSFGEMVTAFRLAFSKAIVGSPADETRRYGLENARLFFVSARHYLTVVAILVFFMGWIILLRNLEDVSHIGRNLALLLISVLYAAFVILFVCLPLENRLKKRLLG